jgi:hypothetical protein
LENVRTIMGIRTWQPGIALALVRGERGAMNYTDVWPQQLVVTLAQGSWTQGLVDALSWGLLIAVLLIVPLVVTFSRALRKRTFWCAQKRRDVEVVMDERGLPGLRAAVAVESCTAFDPPTAVTCQRRCLDADFRRQWDTAVPVAWRGSAPDAGDR